jgi:ribosome-associated protein
MIAKAFQPDRSAVRRPDETPLATDREAKPPSKTRRKAEMDALQELGEQLVELSPARLAELELPERLTEALDAARRITQREARRRQLQFIGRLMRDVDPVPIRDRIARWAEGPNAEKARVHAVERWRERLLSERGALDRLCAERPVADRDRLAALIDDARAEAAHAEPPRAYRELYRTLNRLFDAAG